MAALIPIFISFCGLMNGGEYIDILISFKEVYFSLSGSLTPAKPIRFWTYKYEACFLKN
jgi:hypothetical protein